MAAVTALSRSISPARGCAWRSNCRTASAKASRWARCLAIASSGSCTRKAPIVSSSLCAALRRSSRASLPTARTRRCLRQRREPLWRPMSLMASDLVAKYQGKVVGFSPQKIRDLLDVRPADNPYLTGLVWPKVSNGEWAAVSGAIERAAAAIDGSVTCCLPKASISSCRATSPALLPPWMLRHPATASAARARFYCHTRAGRSHRPPGAGRGQRRATVGSRDSAAASRRGAAAGAWAGQCSGMRP